ncbi:MAG: TonB-dependent receptor [Candidatus Marinimicrobia bacterium]|nr:TonB-dependent receptor [Candidatus Neomarinimicrobiota bacterium]
MSYHKLPCLTLILIIAATIGFTPVFVAAQTTTLSGRVTDAETGEAMTGANVVVVSPSLTESRGAATDANGNYTISDLPVGQYDVTVTYIGYETAAASVSLAAGQPRIIDFALNSKAVLGQELVVSISRRMEKILEAPAAVSVISSKDIEARPTLSPADHLQGIPAVDIVSNGINQKNVVVRGFNNIFSGSLLSLTDNRIGRVPSLRLNAHNFYTMTNEDIERIEVVLGPGSALYGPNSAGGVFHIITKSPFGSEGTIVSLGGGERSILMGSVRHAVNINDRIGFKVSAQTYQGNDWESEDLAEPARILSGQDSISNARNFDVKKIAGEARLDYRVSDDMTVIVNSGFNQATNLEPTGVGWAQADAWKYTYFQGRLLYKNFFAQAFLNQSDAGDSRLLRPSFFSPIVDKSSLSVIQLQHRMERGERQLFTYGIDILRTRPNTEGTINGRNEDDDDINEFGVYLQSKTALTDKLDFVAAGRFDDHSELENPVISPRAALVFKPTSKDNFRLTYNRAFSTPSTNNLFLDLIAASQAMPVPSLVPILGPTLFDVYGRGVPETGFNFRFGDDGRAQMVSLYGGALFAAGAILTPNTYLPPDVNSVWPVIRGLAIAGADPADQALLNAILPAQLSASVPGRLLVLNTAFDSDKPISADNQPFLIPSRSVANVDQIRETTTTTFELGYKGLLTDKFLLTTSVYHTVIEDFVGPLSIETPHVFIDPDTFVTVLTADMVAKGVPLDQAIAIATGIATTFAPLPIGLISPQEEQNATDVIVTYRNFADKIALTGGEIGFTYLVNDHWRIGGNYAYVDKNLFKNLDEVADVALNAPKNKYAVKIGYTDAEKGLDVNLRLRFVGSFPVISAVFQGTVESYSLLDLNLGYDIRSGGLGRTRLTVTAQNLLDNRHQEFVGAPEIGRLVIARITQWF